MYATLSEKSGTRFEVDVLEASQRTLHREEADVLVPIYLTRYELESPAAVEAPGTYQLELASGELFEVNVAICVPLGPECYFISALAVDEEPTFGALAIEVDELVVVD
jgi:hypothetical protein